MAETNGEALMREMNTYLNQAVSAQNDTDAALPFESISDYLGDPTGFNDVTAKLLKKVSAVFDLAGKFNRHSPEYLKSLVQLEKGIKFLGSSCLQKHALEIKKYDFPELRQLNTTNLYTMAALHFNKLDRALTEYMDEHQNVDDGLLDMEYRFYNLMERIRATEVKIYNYRNNYYLGNGNSNPIIHGLAFSDKSWTKSQHEHDEPMAFQRAKAFSAKSEIGNQKSEIASGQCSVVSGQDSGAGCQVSCVSEQDAAAETKSLLTPNSSLLTPHCSEAVPSEIPQCVQIMQQVVMRSRIRGLDYLGFTEREMRLLAADPMFDVIDPVMAADLRKALAEHDSG